MATNENIIPIPGRLHSVATEGHVAGADEIFDDSLNKLQSTINSEVNTALGTGGTVDQKIEAALEDVAYVGTTSGSATVPDFDAEASTVHVTAQTLSEAQKAQARTNIGVNDINERINSAVATEQSRAQGVESSLSSSINTEKSRAASAENTLNQKLSLLNGNEVIVVADHTAVSNPDSQKIYREQGTTSYTDWMYQDSTWKEIATYNPGIDDEPTAGSDNLVKSGGVFNATKPLKTYSDYPSNQGWPDGSSVYVKNYGSHKVVVVNPGDKLEVLGSYHSSGDNGTNLFLLKTYVKPPVNNYTPDFSDSYPTRIDCKYNVLTTITIPSDTHFAVFANVRAVDSVDFSPQSIKINGFDIVKGLQNQVGDIGNLVNSNDYTQKSYNINVVPGWPDGSKVFVMNYGTHFCLPVKPGDVVFNTDGSYYLLRSYKQPSNVDNIPDFVEGYNNQYRFITNNYVVIPEGCNYIAIGVKGGNVTYHYESLKINGISIKERIVDTISSTFGTLIPYSEREEIQGWVDSSNVFVMNYGTHKVLNVNPGDKLRVITGQSYSVGMFFLKTYTKPTTASGGNVPNFSAYQQGIVGVPSHSERTFTIPADTYFIAIEYKIKSSGINVTPECLYINGIDYINGIIPQIGQIGDGAYWKDKKIINSIIQSRMRWNDVSRESGNSAAAYRKHPPVLTFAHFSDLHLADYQLKRIMNICNDHSEYIDDMLFTGDGVDNFSDSFAFWNNCNAQNVMYVIGNHEVRDPGTPTVYHTQAEIYSKFLSNISNWGVTYESDKLYYYKDYPLAGTQEYEIKGIKLIVLYPRLDNIAQADYDVQMQWFVDTLASAKTAGYAVVVAQHFQFEASEVVTEVDCNFSAKNDPHWYGDSLSEDYVTAVQNFINDGGEFITWLGGHMHRDEIIKHTITNQLCICVANASLENLYSDFERNYKAVSNDCLNIISFDIYAKLIKIVRIGANMDYLMRPRNTICINYQTKQILSQS